MMRTEVVEPTPWMTVKEAATRAKCGVKLIYRAVKSERLKAVPIGGRRDIRTKADWVDAWLNPSGGANETEHAKAA
jgi:excisionase family DNA binding protein